MNIIFMGSGEFAVPTLRALAKVAVVCAVYTQPDRPAGRHLQVTAPPVKEEALSLGLPLEQPGKLNEPGEIKKVEALQPDAIIVAAYGQLIPQAILDIPRLGPINLHASLLPKYRGAAPIHWAIMRGERQTGITTFSMDAGLDTGPLLLQRAIRIEADDTVLTVESKLAQVGSLLVLETLDLLAEERLRSIPQDELLTSKAPKLSKEDGQIQWSKSAQELHNFVRGTFPYPGAFTLFEGLRLKLHRSHVADDSTTGRAGEVVGITQNQLFIQTGKGVLELSEVQPASKPRMNAGDFARGYHLSRGSRLG